MLDKCGSDEDLYKQPFLFSSNCITWLIDVHPTWLLENIQEVLHLVVRWHVNIFHTHQRHLYVMDACQNWVMMDMMARNQVTKMH